MADESVKVVGLKDLVRELKKLDDKGLTDGLKGVNFDVAQLVVNDAQGRASGAMDSRAAATLKPGRQAARAVVSGGGKAAPFFFGSEFGAMQNQLRQTPRRQVRGWNQFEPWTRTEGRWLYPAIRSSREKVIEMYGDAIEKITKQAFPD